MYYSMGRNDDAKRVLTIARNQTPKSARIAAYLGMVQLSGGDATRRKIRFSPRSLSIPLKQLP